MVRSISESQPSSRPARRFHYFLAFGSVAAACLVTPAMAQGDDSARAEARAARRAEARAARQNESSIPARSSEVATAGAIKLPTQEREFNPALLKFADRPPIPFKPFVRPDEKTPNSFVRNGMVMLPNGKSLPADQYFRETDETEKWLNSHGYSLRTLSETTPTIISKIPVDEALLRRQVTTFPAQTNLTPQTNFARNFDLKALNAPQPITLNRETAIKLGIPSKLLTPQVLAAGEKAAAEAGNGTLRDGAIVLGPLAVLGEATFALHAQQYCEPFSKSKNWNGNYGDPQVLSASISGSIGYNGVACEILTGQTDTQTHFSVTAVGNVTGSVFGNSQTLLQATGNLAGSRVSNQITAGLNIVVLDQTIASVNQTYDGHWSASNNVSRSVDFSTGFNIPLSIFTLHATVGVQGQAGYQYSLDVYPTAVGFAATPSVKATGYAQVGLNAGIAEVGAGAHFTLVDWKMNAQVSAGLGWYYGALAYGNVYADTKTDLLSGDLFVYVKYWACCHNWVVPYQVQTNHNLFSWSGYHSTNVLFSETVLIPL